MENPRKMALSSLVKSEASGSYTNLEINTSISRSNLSNADLRLYTLLYLGTIEKKIYLDYIIEKYSKIKLSEIELDTKCLLRMGLYQLIFCDKIPDYSAVSESVSLANKKSKGFVNAILRSFLRDNKQVKLPKDKWERLSVEYSIPKGIIDILINSYGEDIAYQICTCEKRSSPLSLRVNTLKTTKNELLEALKNKGVDAKFSEIAKDVILCSTQISEIKEILEKGLAFVQDESSKIATEIFDPKPNEKILDACACPGGKSFSTSIDMENKGLVISCDLHASKLKLIKDGAMRLGISIIEAKEQNGKENVDKFVDAFDRVLVDAPCSGEGMLKKPDIKYKSIESIENLPTVQYEILNNCKNYVKKGGILVYSTCTINKEENEGNVNRFLRENPTFKPVDFLVGNIKSEGGYYTFLPHRDKTDGFFVAKMVRVE